MNRRRALLSSVGLLGIALVLAPIAIVIGFLVQSHVSENRSSPKASTISPLPDGFTYGKETSFDVHLASMTFRERTFVVHPRPGTEDPRRELVDMLVRRGWSETSPGVVVQRGGACAEVRAIADPAWSGGLDPSTPTKWITEHADAGRNDLVVLMPPC